MWIFTRGGFYSVVEYDPKKDPNKKSFAHSLVKKRGSHVLVRTRVKEDLDDLDRVIKNLHIEDDGSADYRFRAVIPRKKWIKYLEVCAKEIDYDSHFKEVVRSSATQPAARYQAMMNVWSAMSALQPTVPYGTTVFTGAGYSSGFGYSGSSRLGFDSTSKHWSQSSEYTKHVPVEIDERAVQARMRWQATSEFPEGIIERMTLSAWDLFCSVDEVTSDKPVSQGVLDDILSQLAEAEEIATDLSTLDTVANSERTQK